MPRYLLLATSSVVLMMGAGCARGNYVAPQPPVYAQAPQQPVQQPVYEQAPPNVQLADRNGFQTGEADGARDVYDGRPYRARSTRAYSQTPGFDGNLGPFGVYQNSFRLAYLRGYDKGYHRG